MKPKTAMKLNVVASAVYALGVWTMIGSLLYYKYTGRFKDLPDQAEEPENQIKKVYQSKHVKTVTICKKDHVPYADRLYSFIQSFTDQTKPGR